MRIELPRYTPPTGRRVDGVFLIDSFGYVKDAKGKPYYYMPDALQYVYMRTGVYTAAVVYPGAGMVDAPAMIKYWQGVSTDMLKFAVFVFMGNDAYAERDSDKYVRNFMAYALDLKYVAAEVFVVYGGSGALWQYDENFKHWYDARVASTTRTIRYELPCWTGAQIWRGLRIADRIGHASSVSYPILARGYVLITLVATNTTRLSRL